MSRKQKTSRFLFSFAVFGVLALSFLVGKHARAISVSFDVLGAAKQLENRYHLNLQSIQDQGENANVASQKGQAPQVLLYFDPSDPKPGTEIEAHAFPEFFGNEKDTLYYTWYIKRKGCGVDNSPSDEKRKLCDRNDDKKITVEDWKIEAMQTVAARNFDSTCSLNGGLSDSERADCAANMYNPDAPSRVNPSGTKGTESDKDGYRATFGGDGRSMFAADCSGGSSGSTGNSSDSSDPFDPTTVDSGSGRLYASDTGTGRTRSITLAPTATFYEIAENFSAENSEFCYEIYGASSTESHGIGSCSGSSGQWNVASNYISTTDSIIGTWMRIISPVSTVFPAGKTYHLYWRDTSPSLSAAKLTVTGDGSGATSCSGHGVCYIHDFSDGYNYELPSCTHLFPKSYEITDAGNIKQVGIIGASDDQFPIKQEHFWMTDPENPSTAQNGNKDEANLAGMGQDVFKWTYAPEDQIGVAVEGTSMYNTKYDNSSMMIMWALPKSKCDVKGKASRKESIKGYDVTIKTSTTDIDSCLEDNLVDPTEGGQAQNIELSLSSDPENPSAKLISRGDAGASAAETAETGDTLVVNATASTTQQDSSMMSYTWRVQASKDGTFDTRFSDGNVWVDITKDLQTAKNIGTPNGNNISSLSIDLNLNKDTYTDPQTGVVIPGFSNYFNDDVAYFRISASATENFSEQASQSGSGTVVVKIVANKVIDVYDVDTVKDAATGTISVKRNSTALCSGSADEQSLCPVLNNQVIGVNLSTSSGEIRDYSWTLNNQPLICTKRVSGECDDTKQGAVNFFPVSGSAGDTYTLTVVANNAETGKSFTVSRQFQIVDPDFDIVSKNEETAWPKYTGDYKNLDGTETKNYSETSFEGIPGATAEFSADFQPEFLGTFVLNGIKAGDTENEMIWSINGRPFKWNDTGLSLALDGNVDDIYTVTLSGAYNQPLELRKALFDIWNVSPFSSETVQFSKEIQIRLMPHSESYTKGKLNTFFASLLSAVPPVVLFSVRLILSMGLILLIVGVAFSVMPEERKE